MASSRKALSDLYAVLVESVEAEFGPLLSLPDMSEDTVSLLSTSIDGQVDVMHDLIRTFRLYDGVGSALCGGVFVRACSLMAAWAGALGDRVPLSSQYLSVPMRSCGVDMIIALVLLAKVGTLVFAPRLWLSLGRLQIATCLVCEQPRAPLSPFHFSSLPFLCTCQHAAAPMLCDKSGAPRHRTECSIKTAVLQVFGEVFSEAGEVSHCVR